MSKPKEAERFCTPSGHDYTVQTAEVIVVGGGLAGITAASIANEQGVAVAVLDKGPFGHSGNTGINWGQSFETAEESTDKGAAATRFLVADIMGILDQEHALCVAQAQIEGKPRQHIERLGTIFQRDDDGNVVGLAHDNLLSASPDAHSTNAAHHLRKQDVRIFENMMMLELVLDGEGAFAGVVALDLNEGTAHFFRGKKVILATGGYHWAKGVTAGSPESTGDAHAALLRRGIPFKDMEFSQYDFSGISPFGWYPDHQADMLEIGISMSVNGDVHHRMYNKKKQQITKAFFENPQTRGCSTFQGALITAAKELYAKNGTTGDGSGNGILFNLEDFKDEPSTQAYPTYKGHVLNIEHNMAYEFPDFYETVANDYSSCGTPWVEPATNETVVSGVYVAFTTLSVRSSMFAWGQGYLAAKDAAAKAKEASLPAFCTDDVEEIIDRAFEKLDKEPEDRIRATEVFRAIQRTFYQGFGFLKNENSMRAALRELKRIEREDVPRVYCADRSTRCNHDWRLSLELENALLCAITSITAGLERQETRPPFFRTDYPRMDNHRFLVSLWTSYEGEGSWKVTRGEIADTLVKKQEIISLLGEVDISIPNNYM